MNPPSAPGRRIADRVLIVLFLGALSLPALGPLLHMEPTVAPVGDRRILAPCPAFPALKREALKWFPGAFEDYYRDHFGYRNLLLWAHVHFEASCLRVSPSQAVVLGKPGWLYHVIPPLGANYQMTRPFTQDELAQWQKVLEARRDRLARQGSRYLVLVVPEKQTIYPELLPARLRRAAVGVRLGEFLTYLHTHSDLDAIDLRPPLLEAKAKEQVYYATDSHWNDEGAFVGYRETAGRLAQWFPAVHPLARSDYVALGQERAGDLALMLNQENTMREHCVCLLPVTPPRARTVVSTYPVPRQSLPAVTTEAPDPLLPRGLVFRDSFMGAVAPFLSEHFRRVVYVWREGYTQEAVAAERPDVVIQEFAERNLSFPIPMDLRAEVESP